MGFYVNVQAKTGCANQINDLWKQRFNGFLIYTPKIIKNEITYIQNDPSQKGLQYVKTISQWNKALPIMAQNKGQVFLRAFGYNEERSEEFKNENEELKAQIQFILDHRLLFKKITNIQDAVDTLGFELDYDYIENGRMKKYETPCFSKLKQIPKNPIFNFCLSYDNPQLWQCYLDIIENKLNQENWISIRNFVLPHSSEFGDTIWQRCEKIAEIRDCHNYGLRGKYNQTPPNEYDLIQAILLEEEKFNEFLKNIHNKNTTIDKSTQKNKLKLVA